MGKKLAIKGHSTRGKEIIELLEMMGGEAIGAKGYDEHAIYVIPENGIIDVRFAYQKHIDNYAIFTLEDFLEKFPYKVGDKVHIYVQNDDIDGRYDIEATEITSMRWNPACCKIAYKMKDINREFYKEEIKCKVDDSNKSIDNPIDSSQFMQMGKTVAVCFNTANYENEVELQLGDYEIAVRDGKTYAVLKKPKYPTTYEECYDEGNTELHFIYVDKDERDLYESFIQLIRCRNAYWKIAGEEMGLDKPWEPDWTNLDQLKYCIWVDVGEFITMINVRGQHILAFPTEEMRDAFFKNFKDLIEQCKELL